MPAVTASAVLTVSDPFGRSLGSVVVESVEGNLILGDFTPGPDYPAVEPVFRTFSDMVEGFSLSLIDVATADIARLGVTIQGEPWTKPFTPDDVQIYPDGGFSCRLPKAAERNGSHPPG